MALFFRRVNRITLFALCLALTACAAYTYHEFNRQYGEPETKDRLVESNPKVDFFEQEVKPILDSRCVVCHACYDAPCQLKLSSAQGIDRGLVDYPVYRGKRLTASDPTRLFVDEPDTDGWRQRGFYPVVNERRDQPEANLEGSLLAKVLDLKARHPLPGDKILSEDHFDFALNRENQCPKVETFDYYAKAYPEAGMPYGLPGLDEQQTATIKQWVADGAWLPETKPLSTGLQAAVEKWEALLNQTDNKSRLFARYFYEHLFLANLFFDQVEPQPDNRSYFKVVRSKTPPGQAIDVIATRIPSDHPGTTEFYYRLQYQPVELVSKTHLPYALNDKREQWITELFFTPQYQVNSLPGYQQENFNPFVTFEQIPARSRYRFLLEEAHFYIAGFIKGPVCRGQVAVDVINDHFWVFFVNPDTNAAPMLDGFLEQQASNLRLPGEQGSNGGLLSYWTTYSELHLKYQKAKSQKLQQFFTEQPIDMNLVWDGNQINQNAALTVFRNFDDAAVRKGIIGNPPKTAWLIDYPLLERIHYLLTVDFDVYGNLTHQLNTRLYMDFLRIEGELNFLTLLPVAQRTAVRDYWYRESSDRLHKHLLSYSLAELPEPAIEYGDEDPKQALYQRIQDRIGPAVSQRYNLASAEVADGIKQPLLRVQNTKGAPAALLSETSILMVEQSNGAKQLFSVLANRAHLNITSLFDEKDNRMPSEDTITVTHGLVGDYPNVIFSVTEQQLSAFADDLVAMEKDSDYTQLVDKYGVRRTNADFWQVSDDLHNQYHRQQPDIAGWLDYNRYDNK
ncbi:fatty acid cis/trans isomerase [Halioxenophilus aromaticivorans]|uniref:Fatty acid cis/trans isomerase n=1 Tax=Halioxenophilus aromaticivorans TaxID=1306992 RepID=A0AAV3U1F7_9ALTE